MAGFGYNTNTENIAMDFGTGTIDMGFGFDQVDSAFAKVNEGSTSNNFLFTDDEGIDATTTSFDPIFSMPTTDAAFSMSHNLALDNTMAASAAWNSPLAPAMDSFPMTPAQSFNSIPQYQSINEMGKRPLHLDVNDFPQPKRHESFASASYSSFAPSPSVSMTGSSWMEAQTTPPSSVDLTGLSDEAADVCALWFSKYAVLPSDRHIDSLSQLTGEPSSAIRQWFGRLLKQGMAGHGDSAYKSQTNFTQQEQPPCTQTYTVPELTASTEQTTPNPPTARGGKKGCSPTQDPELLKHDPSKIYQCTRKCGKRYTRKCDWKRNEEEWYPSKSWLCSLCVSQGTNEKLKPCFRRYHFSQHFRNLHPGLDSNDYEASSLVLSDTDFPRRCGFCPHRFSSRQDRIDHIADHFKKGKCMLDWVDYEDDNSFDNTDDDDDDDKPGNNHYKGNNGSRGSGSGPSGGRGPKQNGSGNGGNGGDNHPHFGEFGKFQLSSSQSSASFCGALNSKPYEHESEISDNVRDQCSYAAPIIFNNINIDREGSNSSSSHQNCSSLQTPDESSLTTTELKQQQTTCDIAGHHQPADVHTDAVAGNAITVTIQRPLISGVSSQLDDKTRISTGESIQQTFVKQNEQPERCRAILDPGTGIDEFRKRSSNYATDTSQPIATDGLQTQSTGSSGVLQTREESLGASTSLSCSPTPPLTTPLSSPAIPDIEGLSVELLKKSWTKTPTNHTQATAAQWREISSLSGEEFPVSQAFLSVKLLGTGGFSTVDEVVHRQTNLRVCRKTLKNRELSAMDELKNEVGVLKKLRHPHIVRFLGAYAKGEKVSILCSPVAETTLALWLKSPLDRSGGYDLYETIFKMFGCLSSTIRYLHEQRPIIKHLDIKPQNILVKFGENEAPHVILSDFGISSAKASARADQSKAVTRQYCAPEVFSGLPREQATDIWSLGCVFVEMLATALSDRNPQWADDLKEFSGSEGKVYWQEIPRLHEWLSSLQDQASSVAEADTVRTIKKMVDSEPTQRPTAATLTMIFTPTSCCLQWANDKAVFPGPQEELALVEALLQSGLDGLATNPAPLCSSDGHENCESHGKQDVTTHSLVKGWLDGCIHDHEACVWHPEATKPLPTRLIEIQPKQVDGLSQVRVVNTADIATISTEVDYVAISHAWSPSDLTLSTDNVHRAQTGLPVRDISAALNEAIATVQKTGYRYVWTDSLCVLQDSVDDKQRECTDMASIYRNAVFTIVLNEREFMENESNRTDLPAKYQRQDQANTNAHGWASPGFSWDTRAWSLQERLLSRRLLYLTDEQLYWECNSLKASETFPRGLPSLIWEKAHTKSSAPAEPKMTSQHPRLLRDCQWLKKSGSAIGDSASCQMQLTLQHPAEKEAPATIEAVDGTKRVNPGMDWNIKCSLHLCDHDANDDARRTSRNTNATPQPALAGNKMDVDHVDDSTGSCFRSLHNPVTAVSDQSNEDAHMEMEGQTPSDNGRTENVLVQAQPAMAIVVEGKHNVEDSDLNGQTSD